MKWYLWVLIVILGLNVFAIAMLGLMMAGDWLAQRRLTKCDKRLRGGDSSEE